MNRIEDKIKRAYHQFDPNRAVKIGKLLNKYHGYEQELLASIYLKYLIGTDTDLHDTDFGNVIT